MMSDPQQKLVSPITPEEQQYWNENAKIRVLLVLWDWVGSQGKVKKGEFTDRICRENENSTTYKPILNNLKDEGLIRISTEKRTKFIQLTPQGEMTLKKGILDPQSRFEFDRNQVGTRLANALLKWIRVHSPL